MQKGNSTGKLPAGKNVNKFKQFYDNLSSSDLKADANVVQTENADSSLKPIVKPAVPDKPVVRPDKLEVKAVKHNLTNNDTCKSPPKPIPPPKPSIAKVNGKNHSIEASTPPDIAPKPKRGTSINTNSEESLDKQGSNEQHNGYHNGSVSQAEVDSKENSGVDVDKEVIEGDEEDDDDGWDSDEFESENDSDDRDDSNLPSKRQSKIIFDELEHIPELGFLDPRKKKLFNIAKEILTTEITYVKTLKLLDQVFYFRLENECCSKGVIPKEALVEIFSNITSIYQFHQDFLLPKLEERMQHWDTTPKVGDIFKYLAPFLKMYTEYVKNFDQAMSSLSKWKTKSPKFASVIEDIQKTNKECNNLTLAHHMLAPVQRVPRYKLLLTDYVSKLPEDSPDLKESKESLDIISSAANHANDSMKKTERFQKLLEIQEKFGDGISIITPSREFIMEGELVKLSKRNAQSMTRILVLFNDSLYYCTKVAATGKYKVKQTVDLLSAHLEDPEIENRDLVFRVCSKSHVADFQASTVEQKDEWVSIINEAIKKVVDKNSTFGREVTIGETDIGKIAPAWVRDDAVTMCMSCTTAFTTLRRRHHCRACGKIVCSHCSSNKASLEYDNNRMNRVCNDCYKILTKMETKKRPSKKIQKFADSVLNGYLNFRTDNTKAWSKRWCMLGDDFTLHVFKAKKDVKAQTTIPLPGYELVKETSNENRVFRISHKGLHVSYSFEADKDETLEKWLHYIEYAIKAEDYPGRSSISSLPTPPPTPTSQDNGPMT